MNSTRLDRNLVARVVATWNIRFREAKYAPEQLDLIAREYYEDLVELNFSNASFTRAAKHARKHCRFFPKIADLIDARVVIGNMDASNRAQIEHLPDLSEEQMEENLKRVRQIIQNLEV